MSRFSPRQRIRRALFAFVTIPALWAASMSWLLGSALASADHHETRSAEAPAEPAEPAGSELPSETRDQKISRLTKEIAGLLERGVEIGESGPTQQTALQQRQREGAQGALISARDAAREFARVVESGASLDDSDPYFRTVRIRVRSARETAGDARPTPEGARLLDELDVALGELGRIYDAR